MIFDLPPKLWVPEKPAIVRAASLREIEATFPLPSFIPRSASFVPALTNIGAAAGSAVASYTITTPAVPAGSLICVTCLDFGSGGPNTCTDTAGNTYTKIITSTVSCLYYAWNSLALSAGNTITITKRDSSNGSLASAFWFSNIQITSEPHDFGVDATAAASTVTSGTPVASGEAFVAYCYDTGTPSSFTGDSGHGWSTSPPSNPMAFSIGLGSGWQVNVGTGTKIWTPTFDVGPTGAAFVTGFKAKGSSVPSTPVSLGIANATPGPNPLTLTTTAAIPAGATVVVCVGAGHTATETHVTGVSDGTNTYTFGGQAIWDGSSGAMAELWYKTNAAAVSSGATISATFNAAPQVFNTGIAAAYAANVNSLDKVNNNASPGGSTTPSSGSTGTLTSTAEVAFGWLYSPGAATPTEDGNFTRLASLATNPATDLAYKLTNATTALNYQPTLSASQIWKCIIATFR